MAVTSFDDQAQIGFGKPPADLVPILERLKENKMQSNVKFEEVTKVRGTLVLEVERLHD